MLNIPEAVKALFKQDGTRKNFRVQFPNGEQPDITNENVEAESVTFTESLCSQNVFRFGLAEASVLEFEAVGVGNMYGMIIEAGIEIDTSSLTAAQISAIESDPGDGVLVLEADSDIGYGFYRVPYGVFRVADCPRDHQSMAHRKVTAYSTETEAISSGAPFFLPDRSMSSSIRIDENAIRALADSALLTSIPGQTVLSNFGVVFFNSSGNIAFFISPPFRTYNIGSVVPPLPAGGEPDFIKVDMVFDADEYYAQGVSLAQSIDAAGYDIRYDSKGNRVYNTTVDALQAKLPALFSPQIICHAARGKGQNITVKDYSGVFNAIAVKSGQMVPVQLSTDAAALYNPGETYNPAFDISAEKNVYPYNAVLQYCGSLTEASTANATFLRTDGTSFTLPFDRCLIDRFDFVKYRLNTISGRKIGFGGKKAAPNYSGTYESTETGVISSYTTKVNLPAYSYLGFEDATTLDLLNGYLEAHGQFCKSDRLGGREIVALDPSAPVSVLPGDYESVWWDEYDISPIGEVVVTYKNELGGEQSTSVSIGYGLSTYEMTDNSMLKNLAPESASGGAVEGLLSGDFAANAANVGFTPIEMTMQGWPWLEAGDAIEITAADDTVVNTYALRIELNGIQRLSAYIESKGGEIIGEVD